MPNGGSPSQLLKSLALLRFGFGVLSGPAARGIGQV
jgi:hypothetical protein